MATDFVGLAYANANQPRADLDRAQQDQNQILGQVLAVAGQQDRRNEFNASMAERATAAAESNRRFDVVRNLQERQFQLQSMQSMASMAAARASQEVSAQNLAVQTRAINEAPLKNAAQATLFALVGSAQTPEELQKAYSQISTNPEITRFIPASEINQTFLNARQNIAGTKLAQINQAKQIKDIDDLAEFEELGGNSQDYLNENGQPNMSLIRQQLGALKNVQADKDADRQTNSRLKVTAANNAARLEQVRARAETLGARLPEATRIKVNGLYKMAAAAQASFETEKAAQLTAQADALLNDVEASSPASTFSAQDQQALDWANSNPQDPRAAQIKKRLGL